MVATKTSPVLSVKERSAVSYLRRRICAHGLTQQQAGALIGREGRQIRRWLKSPPPVLVLLCALEADDDAKEAA